MNSLNWKSSGIDGNERKLPKVAFKQVLVKTFTNPLSENI